MRPGLAGRLSRVLAGCYPRRWRERYAVELLEVLDQHQASTRTVVNLAAGALSTHLDPAYRLEGFSRARLRRAALISAAIVAPLMVIAAPIGYQAWQEGYWHPAAGEPLETAAFSPHRHTLTGWLPSIARATSSRPSRSPPTGTCWPP